MLVLLDRQVLSVPRAAQQDPKHGQAPVRAVQARHARQSPRQVRSFGRCGQRIERRIDDPMTEHAPGLHWETGDACVDPEPHFVSVLHERGEGCRRAIVVHGSRLPGHAARVNRGGSWNNNNPGNVRGANRNRNAPTNRNNNLGFRCARPAAPACRAITVARPALCRTDARGRGAYASGDPASPCRVSRSCGRGGGGAVVGAGGSRTRAPNDDEREHEDEGRDAHAGLAHRDREPFDPGGRHPDARPSR